MRFFVSFASLFVALSAFAVASNVPPTEARDLRRVAAPVTRAGPLSIRSPRRGGSGGGGGDDDEGGQGGSCSSCVECFGSGYLQCPGNDEYCYDSSTDPQGTGCAAHEGDDDEGGLLDDIFDGDDSDDNAAGRVSGAVGLAMVFGIAAVIAVH